MINSSAPKHFDRTFLLRSQNDFWAYDNIFSPLYPLFCIWMKWKTLCTYQQCLIDCNAHKKNTGSTIRFCNLASSVEITYIQVAIEPRRFGTHKMYHIMPPEVRKQSLSSPSSDLWCSWQKRTFSSAKYTFSPTFGQGPRGRIELP